MIAGTDPKAAVLPENEERLLQAARGAPAAFYQFLLSPSGVFSIPFASPDFTRNYDIEVVEPEETARTFFSRVHPGDVDGLRAAIGRSAADLATFEFTFRFRGAAGAEVWIEARSRPERTPDGGILWNGITTDVTNRRNAEDALRRKDEDLEAAKEQLRQSQKMEAIGQLAGGVAHDFNNLLTVITGNADLLLSDLPPGDQRRGPLSDVVAAGERATNLTRQLLAFGRKQILETRLVDVHGIVGRIEGMLVRLLGEGIALRTDLRADPSVVRADPGQLEHVVVNLALNARDAMPRGGPLTIATRTLAPGDAAGAGEAGELRAVSRLAIAITDAGIGIAPEIRGRLFEPFFTTKAFGRGTGLGLATVYGIVKQTGGDITVESEPGKGSTFTVVLPTTPVP